MIQFRRYQPPGGWPLGRRQMRITRLAVTLLLVVWLMTMARRPQSWSWLWQVTGQTKTAAPQSDAPPTSVQGEPVETRVRTPPTDAAAESPDGGTFVSPGELPPNETDVASLLPGLQPALFRHVKDDAAIRAVENDALVHVLHALRSCGDAQLAATAHTQVTFAQMYRQPQEYRGKLLRLSGQVRRADWIRAPRNDRGIERLAELWLQPDDAPTNPLAVYCLELPSAFPQGLQLAEPVTLDGVFFKRWLYNARDGLRTTPLLVARSVNWQPSQPAAVAPVTGREIAKVLVIGAVCGLTAAVYLFRQAGRRRAVRAMVLLLTATAVLGSAEASAQQPPPQETPAALIAEIIGDGGQALAALRSGEAATEYNSDMPTGGKPTEPLLQVLRAVRRVPAVYWSRWLRSSAAVTGGSGVAFISGSLEDCRYVELPAETAARLELPGYYRSVVARHANAGSVILLSLDAPQAWRERPAVGDRVSAAAVLLHEGADSEPATLAAPRIAWHSDTPLGRAGVDVGLLDGVRQRSRLTHADADAFYSIIQAVGRPNEDSYPGDNEIPDGPTTSVVPLFNTPEQVVGEPVLLEGHARRAVRIAVDDAAVQERFGIDHYFEVELFTDDSQGSPLVACVHRLPAGFPQGEAIFERIRVGGYFFKVWAYEQNPAAATFNAGENPDSMKFQLAPLILGETLHCLPRPAATLPAAGGAALALLAAAALGGALWLWRQHRQDALHAARRRGSEAETSPAFLRELAENHQPPTPGPSEE